MIPVSELNDHEENESIYGPMGEPDPELVKSIRERGILQPLIVADAEDCLAERWVIIAGHRRKNAAIAAGLESVPCEVREYESIEEEIIDLIHSNKHRIKTQKQINDEVIRLREALSVEAEERKRSGLRKGDTGGESPLPPIGGNGRTSERIAESTGLSEKDVERRTVVCDPTYRAKFYDELAELSGTKEVQDACAKQWANIHMRLDRGELSVSAAAKEVKALQQEFRELCPKYKAPKKVTKKRTDKPKQEKVSFNVLSVDDLADEDDYREYGDADGIGYGMVGNVPALRTSDSIMFLDWEKLVRLAGAKLKKAA